MDQLETPSTETVVKGAPIYDDEFYEDQIAGSYKSAVQFVQYLSMIINPKTVADAGCGRGTWLKAFKEHGATRCVGFDGPWNSQSKMLDQGIDFVCTDLNESLSKYGETFDLALSLEVAEHLEATSAVHFIKGLTSLSKVIIFGAAYSGQGGTEHINEQPHTYWAKLLGNCGYRPYDLFRPKFWGNEQIEPWYQQNTFLYVHESSDVNAVLMKLGHRPIENLAFMNCIHPWLYGVKLKQLAHQTKFRRIVKSFIPAKFLR